MDRAVPIHLSQTDRQTIRQLWPSSPCRRAAQAGSTPESRAGDSPGGARLIPRQTDRQTDRWGHALLTLPGKGVPHEIPGRPGGAWLILGQRPVQAGLAPAQPWLRPETPHHAQLLVGPAGFLLGEVEPDQVLQAERR